MKKTFDLKSKYLNSHIKEFLPYSDKKISERIQLKSFGKIIERQGGIKIPASTERIFVKRIKCRLLSLDLLNKTLNAKKEEK